MNQGCCKILQQNSVDINGDIYCIYGDCTYPVRLEFQGPVGVANLNADQRAWNEAMSSVRVSAKWLFRDIKSYVKFIDLKKNDKIQLSVIRKLFIYVK